MTTICVDPGVSGGIVVAHEKEIWNVFPMPETSAELACELHAALRLPGPARCFVELVSGYIGEAHPGSKMFVFGKSSGIIEGFCLGAQIPLEPITPFSWQQRLGLGLRSECPDKPAWKRKLKAEAVRRFPSWTPTLKTADALLLWDFVRIHRPWRASARRQSAVQS